MDRAVRAPRSGFPGVALYVRRDGSRAWSGAAGRADVATGRLMRPTDRVRAGSIMKPFIAVAILQLVEEGRLALDDPLPAVLPPGVIARFPEAAQITVRMLLNHTSGIGNYADEHFDREVAADQHRRWTVGELLDRAAALPRIAPPGERFSYSNANYNLLGQVLEQATGRPWRAVVRERVIARLNLTHTSLPRPGLVPRHRGIAHGYQEVQGKVQDFTDVDSSMAGAAGGHAMLTTAGDLSRFLHAVLAGRVFRHGQTAKEMQTFVAAQSPDGLTGYGLGLERYLLPGGVEIVGHVGSSAGYRTFMFRLPAQRIDLTISMNGLGDPSAVLFPALKLVLAAGSSGRD